MALMLAYRFHNNICFSIKNLANIKLQYLFIEKKT